MKKFGIILIILFLSVLNNHSVAQNLEVNAKKLEVLQQGKVLVYTGKVRASFKKLKIHSDRLKDVGKKRFVAQGNVHLSDFSDSEKILEGWGKELEFFREESKGILTGSPRLFYKTPDQKVHLVGKKIIFWEQERRIEVIDNAHATIFLKKDEDRD